MPKIHRLTGNMLPDLFLEIVSIVIGILLAFWLNDWQTDRQHEQTVRKSLKNIKSEIQNNLHHLKKVMPYHQSCQLAISTTEPDSGLRNFLAVWKGLNPPMLYQSAYESAREVQAFAYMDYETASAISSLYSRQKFLLEMIRMYAQGIINDYTIPDSEYTLKKLLPAFTDIVQSENEL